MDHYREKLIEFNNRDKYQHEMDFVITLMNIKDQEVVLDYGCGTGLMVDRINRNTQGIGCGYDVNDYKVDWVHGWFGNHLPDHMLDKVYFMHSLAHISDAGKVLDDLKEHLNPGATVFVLTPNSLWLQTFSNNGYEPDTTALFQYAPAGLNGLFSNHGYKVLEQGQMGTVRDGYNERLYLKATL